MRKKEVKDGPPDLPKRKDAVADEEQQWFHGPMSRERAEAILQGFAACDGLFLVRASERCACCQMSWARCCAPVVRPSSTLVQLPVSPRPSWQRPPARCLTGLLPSPRLPNRTPSDVVISFYIGGHVFHNKLHKVADGYQNSNGNTFPNLRCAGGAREAPLQPCGAPCTVGLMDASRLIVDASHLFPPPPPPRTIVLLYQGKHPDMQTVLTEYVPRERAEQGGVEYANASVMRDNKPSPITVR